jgi:hypothetical protein
MTGRTRGARAARELALLRVVAQRLAGAAAIADRGPAR